MKKIIETERLILRPFTGDDAKVSYEMNTDPNVMKYLGGVYDGTIEGMRKMLENSTLADYKKHGFGRFAVIHQESQEFMGFTGLKYIEELDEVDVGYRLHHKFWKQGYGYESALPCLNFAFNDLQLDRIIGMADPENVASIKLLEKLGLRYEKQVHIYGDFANYYALNKSDWIKMNE